MKTSNKASVQEQGRDYLESFDKAAQALTNGMIYGEKQPWGLLRFTIGVFLFLLATVVVISLFKSILAIIPTVTIAKVPGWRFIVMPFVAVLIGFGVGTKYVKDIYELPNFRIAFKYVCATLFGLFVPRKIVEDGKTLIEPDEVNPLDVIGGPGSVHVRPGSAILLETLHEPSNVYGTGFNFISRFERIRETFCLEEQDGYIEKMSATTKDGIEVEIRDVRFRYRILFEENSARRPTRTAQNPYPFSKEAIKNSIYGRTVNTSGLNPWLNAIKFIVDSSITDYIQCHQIDPVTAPRHLPSDPRMEIETQIKSKSIQDRLKDLGVEVTWVDIGHFEIPEKRVGEMYFQAWQEKRIGDANLLRAHGEAQRLVYQDQGRAEGQAAMVVSIVSALQDAGLPKAEDQDGSQRLEIRNVNIRKILLSRTAQILESMTSIYQSTSPDEQIGSRDDQGNGGK